MDIEVKNTAADSGTSSDSDDDNMAKLKSAVDPDFKLVPSSECTNGHSLNSNGSVPNSTQVQIQQPKQKSNRKALETEWEAGHFVHPLKLSTHSQDFVFKQLSRSLDSQIKGVKRTIVQHEDEDEGIYLFHSSSRRLSGRDLRRSDRKMKKKVLTKPKIEKRKIDADSSSSDEDSKLLSVAVSADWVRNPTNI